MRIQPPAQRARPTALPRSRAGGRRCLRDERKRRPTRRTCTARQIHSRRPRGASRGRPRPRTACAIHLERRASIRRRRGRNRKRAQQRDNPLFRQRMRRRGDAENRSRDALLRRRQQRDCSTDGDGHQLSFRRFGGGKDMRLDRCRARRRAGSRQPKQRAGH